MPISLQELANAIQPSRTVLFMGAGTSIPSGGPTGSELVDGLARDLSYTLPSGISFSEAMSLLELSFGRPRIIERIRARLLPLKPIGGICDIPKFDWAQIFTTNFDQLIEQSYTRSGRDRQVIRSDYDFTPLHSGNMTRIFKVHGCVSQDSVDGHRAAMTLTEDDYEQSEKYRENLFSALYQSLSSVDVVFVGYSISDPNIKTIINKATDAIRENGYSGRVFCLFYDPADERARIFEAKGIRVAFGGIDDFVASLRTAGPAAVPVYTSNDDLLAGIGGIRARLKPVEGLLLSEARPNQMARGRPASYGDIARQFVFKRDAADSLVAQLVGDEKWVATIIGPAGVGKTTLARSVLAELQAKGMTCFEHNDDEPLLPSDLIEISKRFKANGRVAAIFVDECHQFLGELNRVVRELSAAKEPPAVRLVLTANKSLWTPRVKDKNLFSKGSISELGALSQTEIGSLIQLCEAVPEFRSLMSPDFRQSSRTDKLRVLRGRCSGDMFVCLKNIFSSDSLDEIILQEYADIPDGAREIYRYVSALEAAGVRVHRQLVLRTLNFPSDEVANALRELDGIVAEYIVDGKAGIFGWETRHSVIARLIASYKFADQDEKYALLKEVARALNPVYYIEMRTVRDICDREFGIGSLSSIERQNELLALLIETAPGERVPRHRLIKNLLNEEEIEAAERQIELAEREIGGDAPMHRYKIQACLIRSRRFEKLRPEDRYATLLRARELAVKGCERYPDDKYNFITLCDVGFEVYRARKDASVLSDALIRLRQAETRILDPQISTEIAAIERKVRQMQIPVEG